MSRISTGIGLVSGIDTASLISQLMAIEARPVQALQARVRSIDVQRTALLDISAKLLAAQNAGLRFNRLSLFRSFSAASSDDRVVAATAGETATPGSHTFRVHSLVANHALLSRGFADSDATPVGVGALTIEIGHGSVNPSTELDTLRGGAGIRRGVIRITDRSGRTADVDLSTALTIDDVLAAINSNAGVRVRASVTGLAFEAAVGDRIVIEDASDGAGNLIIADVPGGSTAADLGIVANVAAGRVDGAALVRLALDTPLSLLNDGNGVDRLRPGRGNDLTFVSTYGTFDVSLSDALKGDTDLRVLNGGHGVRLGLIRISDRSGRSAEVDLSLARTVQDVRDAIEAADVAVTATFDNQRRFQIRDTSGLSDADAGNLIVADVSGFAAADLGIAGNVDDVKIDGRDIYRVSTVGDVIRAINFAAANAAVGTTEPTLVRASLSNDGKGIKLEALGFNSTVTVSAAVNATGFASTAAADLGLSTAADAGVYESRDLIAGLDTVLLRTLNGGAGVRAGTVRFTDLANQTATIDFSASQTLAEVIERINADPTIALTASVNSAGNGIVLRDESGGNNPQVVIEDVTGGLAADLHLIGAGPPQGSSSPTIVSSGNLQVQYITRQTRLADLNGGQGVSLGAFRITDSTGAAYTIHLPTSLRTVGELLDEINGRAAGTITPDTLQARINDQGDGIVIVDATTGTQALAIEDLEGGSTAADLRIAGTARPGTNRIDGSYEFRVEIEAGDTLDRIIRKLNDSGASVSASVLNDGGAVSPFSLTITSTVSGRRGALVVDSGGLDLGLQTMTKAQDAIVTVGAAGAGGSLLITSPSNTVDHVIPGVTLELLSVDDQDVTVTVAQDVDEIVEAIQSFVDGYNEVQSTIDDHTQFNQETLERGPLLGDSTVNLVRTRLHRVLSQRFPEVEESVSRLFSIGLKLGANNRLEFDAAKFRDAYAESPEAVERLFTLNDKGFGDALTESLTALTRDFDGVLSRRNDLLNKQQDLINDRIDGLNKLLDAKRARLEAQFQGLESALAALQAQQNALALISRQTTRP